MTDFKEENDMNENKVKSIKGEKVRKLFDRVWSTVMIVVNTAFGILLAAAGFAAVGDEYFCKYHWTGILVGILTLVAVNAINWYTRRMFKNY